MHPPLTLLGNPTPTTCASSSPLYVYGRRVQPVNPYLSARAVDAYEYWGWSSRRWEACLHRCRLERQNLHVDEGICISPRWTLLAFESEDLAMRYAHATPTVVSDRGLMEGILWTRRVDPRGNTRPLAIYPPDLEELLLFLHASLFVAREARTMPNEADVLLGSFYPRAHTETECRVFCDVVTGMDLC